MLYVFFQSDDDFSRLRSFGGDSRFGWHKTQTMTKPVSLGSDLGYQCDMSPPVNPMFITSSHYNPHSPASTCLSLTTSEGQLDMGDVSFEKTNKNKVLPREVCCSIGNNLISLFLCFWDIVWLPKGKANVLRRYFWNYGILHDCQTGKADVWRSFWGIMETFQHAEASFPKAYSCNVHNCQILRLSNWSSVSMSCMKSVRFRKCLHSVRISMSLFGIKL